MTRLVLIGLSALVILSLARPAAAQVPNLELAMKIAQARKENGAKMHQFTWTCRTEVFQNGQTMDNRLEQVSFGPDGGLQRSMLNDEHAKAPGFGFMRKLAFKEKMKEMEELVKGLHGLLEQYTMSSAGKVIDFLSSANVEFVQSTDGKPQLRIKGSSVVSPADSMTVWCDPTTHAMARVEVTTSYQGSTAVTMTAWYKTSPSSKLTYVSMAEVKVPDKQLTVQVHNYDYEPNN
jgi:hypothetical protein